MKKLFSGIIVLTIVLVLVSNLFAQKSKDRLMKKGFGIEKLNLTEDQKTKFDEIRFTHQEKVIDLKAQLRKNQLEIKRIFASNEINESEVINLTGRSNEIKADLKNSKVKMWFDVNKILNDDQKQIWKNHFKDYRENRKAKFENNNNRGNRKDNFRRDKDNRTGRKNLQN
jgi:Spy/CpxP family protein refolding chaperone